MLTGRRSSKIEQSAIQFKALIRFMLDALKDIECEPDKEKQTAKLQRVIGNLQKTLEDE